jgi:Flp pilus assembly protein TadB
VTALTERGDAADREWAVAPWVAVALTPVGLFVGLFFVLGAVMTEVDLEESANFGFWLLIALSWLTMPMAAEILAARAVRAGRRSGRISALVAGLLLVAMIVFYALGAINTNGQNWIIVSVVIIAALGLPLLAWTYRRKRAGDGADAPEVRSRP